MPALFQDRRDAGRRLAAHLKARSYRDPLILGLPRGGVPVAVEVAVALGAEMDVFVVRKLGVPGHEELAMGAIASGGVRVLMPDVIGGLGITSDAVERVARLEQLELERREREYRGARPFPCVRGRTVIIVDDGVATGASMLAAIRAVRALHAVQVVAAAPVIAAATRAGIVAAADACEALAYPEHFLAVGAWYGDFSQTTDNDVTALLHDAHDRQRHEVESANAVAGPGAAR